MTTITSPIDLPAGWHHMYCVESQAEAVKVADGRKAYLFQSKIIKALYVFVPVGEQ